MVRPASTAERAMGSARNRSMRPFCRSSARPMLVLTEPNDHRLHEDARHQVVDVVVPGIVDGPAEHVAEQQHEHDRLHAREEDRLRDARVVDEVALGHGDGVGETAHRRRWRESIPCRPTRSGRGWWSASIRRHWPLPPRRADPASSSLFAAPPCRLVARPVAGQGEEHVVEARLAQGEVGHRDVRAGRASAAPPWPPSDRRRP